MEQMSGGNINTNGGVSSSYGSSTAKLPVVKKVMSIDSQSQGGKSNNYPHPNAVAVNNRISTSPILLDHNGHNGQQNALSPRAQNVIIEPITSGGKLEPVVSSLTSDKENLVRVVESDYSFSKDQWKSPKVNRNSCAFSKSRSKSKSKSRSKSRNANNNYNYNKRKTPYIFNHNNHPDFKKQHRNSEEKLRGLSKLAQDEIAGSQKGQDRVENQSNANNKNQFDDYGYNSGQRSSNQNYGLGSSSSSNKFSEYSNQNSEPLQFRRSFSQSKASSTQTWR